MKLAAKLILVFMLGVLAIVSLFAWQTVDQQRRWQAAQRRAHATQLVATLQPAIIEAFREGGFVRIQQVVEVTQQYVDGPQLRWLDPETARRQDAFAPKTGWETTTSERTRIVIGDQADRRVASTYIPLQFNGQNMGAIEVTEPLAEHESSLREAMTAALISLSGVAGLSALVILVGGIWLVGKPLNKLIEQVDRIGMGDMPQPAVVHSHDELGRLAKSISHMSERLSQQRDAIRHEMLSHDRTQQQLRHADRLGTVGTLAAGVAHELGTPLNVVAGRAGLIAGGQLTPAEVITSAQTIKSEAERMTVIIRQLLDFARHKAQPSDTVALHEIIRTTYDLMRPLAEKNSVQIVLTDLADPSPIRGDPAQLQQVITNLLVNAIQAMPDGGQVILSTRSSTAAPPAGVPQAEQGFVCVQVTDSGVGMNEDELSHVFEPFYTTKDTGQGTGLGLSIAYGIVRDHGGWIETESAPEVGTTFRVYLPHSSANR